MEYNSDRSERELTKQTRKMIPALEISDSKRVQAPGNDERTWSSNGDVYEKGQPGIKENVASRVSTIGIWSARLRHSMAQGDQACGRIGPLRGEVVKAGTISSLSIISTGEGDECIVVVALWVCVKCIPVGLQIDNGFPIALYRSVHVPARGQGNGEFGNTSRGIERRRGPIRSGEGDSRVCRGESNGPKGVLKLLGQLISTANNRDAKVERTIAKLVGLPTPSGASASLG